MKVHVSIEGKSNLDDLYKEFPCLMRSRSTRSVVLFCNIHSGTVVSTDNGLGIGHYYNNLDYKDFELLPEGCVIKLQNKRELTEDEDE